MISTPVGAEEKMVDAEERTVGAEEGRRLQETAKITPQKSLKNYLFVKLLFVNAGSAYSFLAGVNAPAFAMSLPD